MTALKKNSLYNPVKDYSLIIRKQTGVRPVCLVWTCLSVINSQPLTSLVANCQWLPLTQPWCSEANSASYLHNTLAASKCFSNTLGLRSCICDDRKLSGLLLANDNTSSPSSLFIEQTETQCGVNLQTTQIPQRVSTTLAYMGWEWLQHKPEWVSGQTTTHSWLEWSLHVKKKKAQQIHCGKWGAHNIKSETECRHITRNQSYGKTDVAGGWAAIHESPTAKPISSW